MSSDFVMKIMDVKDVDITFTIPTLSIILFKDWTISSRLRR